MRVSTGHDGTALPFERDRTLVLRRLPVGATVTAATVTVRAHSADPGGRFLETIGLAGPIGDWGASKRSTADAVEVDLRARRTMASMVGSGLANGPLLVDVGGGYLAVNDQGGLGGTARTLPGNTPDLPGLTVTGLRVARAGADVSSLTVSSPPTNVTVALGGGPVFLTHLGPLVDSASADVGALLQALLPEYPVENGCHVVPFVVHSDTIARLELGVDIDYVLTVDALPDAVSSVHATYAYDGDASEPVAIAVAVPPGSVAVPGRTAGRVQGGFDPTRVVFGPVTDPPLVSHVELSSDGPLAQPFTAETTVVASAIDVLVTAVTAEVELAVDVVSDLDGKPGRASLLPSTASVRITRDTAGEPTWVSVPLPADIEPVGGTRYWVTLQAREGTATWGVAPNTSPEPALQRTGDGGLSWRRVSSAPAPAPAPAPMPVPVPTVPGGPGAPPASDGFAAQFRLRHPAAAFDIPLELRVRSGAVESAVSLQRFAAQGAVDIDLGFPAVAEAVNATVAAAGGAPRRGEHVANGDFSDWFRVGTAIRRRGSLTPSRPGVAFGGEHAAVVAGPAVGYGPDNRIAFFGTTADNGDATVVAADVFGGFAVFDTDVGSGVVTGIAVDPAGAVVVAATRGFVADVDRSHLVLLDAVDGSRIGVPVATPEPVVDLVALTDGSGLALLGVTGSSVNGSSTGAVRSVSWAAVRSAATTGGTLGDIPGDRIVSAQPLAIAAGPDGQVVVLTGGANATRRLHSYAGGDLEAGRPPRSVDADDEAVDIAVHTDASGQSTVLVLGPAQVSFRSGRDLRPVGAVDIDSERAPLCLGVDPIGEIAVVIQSGAVVTIDLRRRRAAVPTGVAVPGADDGARLALSPAGTHGLVTRPGASDVAVLTIGDAVPVDWTSTAGVAQPVAFESTGEALALLGERARDDATRGRDVSRGELGGTVPAPELGPSGLAQIVPVTGGAMYRFGFDGLAETDGAVVSLTWRASGCRTVSRTTVAVTALDQARNVALERIPHHERVLSAPPDATQVEIRAVVGDGMMLLDHVTLTGAESQLTVADPAAWGRAGAFGSGVPAAAGAPPAGGGTVQMSYGAGGIVVTGGAGGEAVAQSVAVNPGDTFDVRLAATVSDAGAQVRIVFRDEASTPVADPITIALDPFDFDDRAANGVVPEGANDAEVTIAVPPGVTVTVHSMSLVVAPATTVELTFVSQAPGELTATGVTVDLDDGEPVVAPVPSDGLCPVVPEAGDGSSCYCCRCGTDRPVTRTRAVVTDAGRPGVLTPCPRCGTPRVRLGGRVSARADRVGLPRFRVADRAVAGAPGRPVIVPRWRVDLPLEAVRGVAERRAEDLIGVGIGSITDLASADPDLLARLPGMSRTAAASIVADARRLVALNARPVLFDR